MRVSDLFSAPVLLEYDRSMTARKLGPDLLRAARNDALFLDGTAARTDDARLDALLSGLEAMDPSPTKKYVLWLARQYLKGAFRIEDAPRVKDVVARYVAFRPQFKRLGHDPDLNRYGFHALEALLDRLSGTKLAEPEAAASRDDVKVLYDGPYGTLAVPTTMAAAIDLGRGTKWCTAWADPARNRFDSYASKGPLYVWRDRTGDKYQFHFETKQFMDSSDQSISQELFRAFRTEHPVLSKLFRQAEQRLLREPILAFKYAEEWLETRWPEFEAVIKDDPQLACRYACAIWQRWPEIEPMLVDKPQLAFDYSFYAMGNQRWPEAEPYIMRDPLVAFQYAMQYFGRWPEAEPFIMKSPQAAVKYAKHVIKGRWREAEPYIMKDGLEAYRYMTEVMHELWPEAEPAILNSDAAHEYRMVKREYQRHR